MPTAGRATRGGTETGIIEKEKSYNRMTWTLGVRKKGGGDQHGAD